VCFCRDSRCRLFTGVVSLALTRLHNVPVLQANSYGEDGMLIDAGAWAVQTDGQWRRVDVSTSRE
jgi:hypothetical protein